TAFDPKARPGARRMIGTVADWLESRKYVQLLADGEIAYSPLPESTLAGEPRFLPDIPTGGRLVFLGPAMRASLELRCDFPNAKSSLDGQVFRPRGITIPLEGKRPGLQAAKALVSVTDDVFGVSVTGVAVADELAGRKAEEGKRFITLEVTVRNTGKQGELFQTSEQLKLALSDGALLPIDAAALESLRPPLPLLWIPPGERRTFQAAYRAPVIEAKLRLAYSGVSLQKMLDLPLPGPAPEPATVVAAPVKAPDAPEAKPRSPAEKPLAKRPEPPGEAQPAAQLPAPAAVPTPPAATQPVAAKPDAATPAAKPERDPRGLAGVGLTPEKVNESIDRGAAFLWRHLKEKDLKNGRKLGGFREHTISALALVHSGAHRKYPDLDAALREYLPAIDLRRGDVYEAGITCMLVEAYEDPSFLPTLRAAVRYILEIQGPEGSWTYSRRLPEDILRDPAEDRVIQVTGGVPLDGSEASAPVSRATPWKDGVDGDNSVSQYALLGLQSASRAGVRVDAEVWERSLASFRARQGDDGNWNYHNKSARGYGSMTCAGICSIAIARHEWGEKDPAADPAVEKGLRWIGANFSLEKHPQTYPPERWRFYYLYSLERVGRVLGLDFIGEHEWYPEGAKHLVSTQLADGSWVGDSEEKDPRLATSFALLFLTRSTPSLKPQEVKRGGSGILKTGLQLPRGNRYYVILDASGSMLAEMDGKSKWQIARDAVAHLVEDLADNSEVALRVYGHRKRAIDQGASDDTALEIPLRPLVKKDFLAKLDSLRPRGKTPLARSLLEAKRDLGNAAASDPVTVILLTDGGEDTLPRQDPVRAAAEFGLLEGVRLHVVGFDIGREEWSAQLRAIAGRARGSYWPALQAESLYTELRSAVFGVPAGFAVLDPAGKEAASGPFGKEISLPEGRYVFQTRYGGAEHAEGFWINTDRATSVVFNAARVAGLRPVPGDAGPAANAKPAPRPGTKPGAAPGDTKPAPEKPKPMFCTECGKPMKSDAKFCTECGAKVKG
ncbi:MAG TPA: VWA domain-containing protein, partial [Planctomycetota bacterium]|nr:VWA domain-containing protein [Planctomycetota bacterium]